MFISKKKLLERIEALEKQAVEISGNLSRAQDCAGSARELALQALAELTEGAEKRLQQEETIRKFTEGIHNIMTYGLEKQKDE